MIYIETSFQTPDWHLEFSRPLRQSFPFSFVFDESITTPIVGLLQACRPAAISRFVVSVIINTIQGIPAWASTHVSNKRSERCAPIFAHPNSSSAIVCELRRRWTRTSSTSRLPCTPFFTSAQSVLAKPVSILQAATSALMSITQVIGTDNCCSATTTQTLPVNASGFALRSTNRYEIEEGSPGQINRLATHLPTKDMVE